MDKEVTVQSLCDLIRKENLYQQCALFIALQSSSSATMFNRNDFADPYLQSVFLEIREYWDGKRKTSQCHRIAKWLTILEIDRSEGATKGLKKKLEEQHARKEAQDQMMKLHRLAFG